MKIYYAINRFMVVLMVNPVDKGTKKVAEV
jgi:hypothetical protein